MNSPNTKSKADYNVISVYVRGDRDYVYELKRRANAARKPLADYIREQLDSSFFANTGKPVNHDGK